MQAVLKPSQKILARGLCEILDGLMFGEARGRLCILNYHRVLKQEDPLVPGDVSRDVFEWQMSYISEYFNVITLRDAIGFIKNGVMPTRSVVVTFDDGYADNEKYALPILKQYDVPATFFITTAYIDKGRMWNDTVRETIRSTTIEKIDLSEIGLGIFSLSSIQKRNSAVDSILKRIKYLDMAKRQEYADYIGKFSTDLPNHLMLSSDQIRRLHAAGMEIGCHTVNHPILSKISLAAAKQEIRESKAFLESIVKDDVSLFAYPNGVPGVDFGPEHIDIVKEAGFIGAVSTRWGVANVKSDIWQLPRFRPWSLNKNRYMLSLASNYLRLAV